MGEGIYFHREGLWRQTHVISESGREIQRDCVTERKIERVRRREREREREREMM